MASFHHASRSMPPASFAHVNPNNMFEYPNDRERAVGSARVSNILDSYPNEQVVSALMTQLREKEAQLAALSEQRLMSLRQQQAWEESNRQLRGRVERSDRSVAEKDAKIAQLEERLADARVAARLEEELDSVRGELAAAGDEKLALGSAIEELEKKLKGKEWVVKSLRDESSDQRGRENHLRAHIEKLQSKVEAYEAMFEGKGVDVPTLITRLKDSEAWAKDLQRQVRRLTNKKPNEPVLRSTQVPKQQWAEMAKDRTDEEASDASPSLADCGTYDEEDDVTFASTLSDDVAESFYARSDQDDEDVLGGFLSDVRAGVESLGTEGLCCAPPPPPGGARGDDGPVSSPRRPSPGAPGGRARGDAGGDGRPRSVRFRVDEGY